MTIFLLLINNFSDNLSDKFGSQINDLWDNFGSDFTYPGNLPSYVEEYFEDQEGRTTVPSQTLGSPAQHIQCLPHPGLLIYFLFLSKTNSVAVLCFLFK